MLRVVALVVGVTGLFVAACATAPASGGPPVRPLVDHHKHLATPAAAQLVSEPPPASQYEPVNADQLVAQLDRAGIGRAVVLSVAYWFGAPRFTLPNEYALVRAENDWTAQQVARYPDRLVGFCSVNPLKEYAIDEITRCATQLHLRGLKLHFGSSKVDVTNPDHLTRTRRVFDVANRLGLPIVVHARGSRTAYGSREARLIVDSLIATAPEVPIQIAHLWGGAEYSAEALAVFADAASTHDARMRRVWFDVTDIMTALADSAQALPEVAARMRQIGMSRLLWGSDMSPPGPTPLEAWRQFQTMPLTAAEFGQIAGNVAPYMK